MNTLAVEYAPLVANIVDRRNAQGSATVACPRKSVVSGNLADKINGRSPPLRLTRPKGGQHGGLKGMGDRIV